MSFFIGIILLVAGAIITIKSEMVYGFFGPIAVFEKYFGTEGGSRLGYKLIGMLASFIGILLITGLFEGFMMWILSPLTGLMGGPGA